MRIIHSLDELLELPHDRDVNGLRMRAPVRLEIPALSPRVLANAQQALNSLQDRDGPLTLPGVMCLAFIAGLLQVFQRRGSLLTAEALPDLCIVLVASFALGVVARLGVLAFTRWQFAYRCRVQHRLLSMQQGWH